MCWGFGGRRGEGSYRKNRAEKPSLYFYFLILVFFLSLVVCMCHNCCRYIFLDTFDIPRLCEAFAFGSASVWFSVLSFSLTLALFISIFLSSQMRLNSTVVDVNNKLLPSQDWVFLNCIIKAMWTPAYLHIFCLIARGRLLTVHILFGGETRVWVSVCVCDPWGVQTHTSLYFPPFLQ